MHGAGGSAAHESVAATTFLDGRRTILPDVQKPMLQAALTLWCGCLCQTRDAIARFVEEEQRLAGDSLRPGPWMMPEADPPGFYPVPAEIMKDRERMAKVGLSS